MHIAKLREDRLLLFDQVPLLRIDGLNLVQSKACVRYLAEKHNLRGATPAEVATTDMLAEGIADWKEKFGKTFEFAYGAHEQTYERVARASVLPSFLPSFLQRTSLRGRLSLRRETPPMSCMCRSTPCPPVALYLL